MALLAQVGTGGFDSVPEACDATIRLAERTERDPKVQPFYDSAYAALPAALSRPPRLVRGHQQSRQVVRRPEVGSGNLVATTETQAASPHHGTGTPCVLPDSTPATPDREPFWTRRRVGLAVLLILVAHLTLAVRSLVEENPTIDEVIHLPAGITYWQTGRFGLYHHNPPLIKLVAALPVIAMRGVVVPYEAPSWSKEPQNKAQFAHEFQQAQRSELLRAIRPCPTHDALVLRFRRPGHFRLVEPALRPGWRTAQSGPLVVAPISWPLPARDDRCRLGVPRSVRDLSLLALAETTHVVHAQSSWGSP